MKFFSVVSNSLIIREYIVSHVCPESYSYLECLTGNEMLSVSFAVNPSILIVDLSSFQLNAVELIKQLTEKYHCKVLVLYQSGFNDLIIPCILAGAHGAIEHNEVLDMLLIAMNKTLLGEVWLNRETTSRFFIGLAQHDTSSEQQPNSNLITLTKKEFIVAKAAVIDSDIPLKQLASKMNIAESTLRNHLANIYKKLGVGNRTGLILLDREVRFSA